MTGRRDAQPDGPSGVTRPQPAGAVPASGAERLHLAFRHAPIGIALHGPPPDWPLLAANPRLCELLGCDEADLIARGPRSFHPREDWKILRSALARLVDGTSDTERIEQRLVTVGGKELWTAITVRVERDPAGEITQALAFFDDVGERLQIEGQFRAAAEGSLHSFVIFDAVRDASGLVVDFAYSYANERARRSTEGARGLPGRRLRDVLWPEAVDALVEKYARVVATGEPLEEEFVVGPPDDPEWIRQQVVAVGGDSVAVSARNVTQRKREAEERRALEARFEALLRHSRDVLVVSDPEGVITYVSPGAEQVIGWRPDEIVGTDGLHLIHAEDRPAFDAHVGWLVAHPGEPCQTELRLHHADGSWRWAEAVMANLLDDRSVRAVVSHFRDITQRKLSEVALRASEERFRSLVRHSSDVVAVTDEHGELRYVSPAAEHVLGYTEQVARESPLADLVHPDDREAWREHFGCVLDQTAGEQAIEVRMRHADGSWLWIEARANNLFEDPAVDGVLVHLRDVSERRRAEAELEHQALHDPLTGLPNRALLLDRVTRALARSQRTGLHTVVLFCDLDRFKVVNDSLGHAYGDDLLVAAAARLRAHLREVDTVARLGGDEFVVLLDDVPNETVALDVGDKLLEAMRRPFRLAGREFFVAMSVGLAMSSSHTATAESLLRDADAAMYVAKAHGRNRLEVFDEAVRHRAVRRLEMEHDLHRALERGELRLAYQPSFEMRGRQITGVEALLRWDHPRRGPVYPGEFITVAEDTGLIIPIGEWVIEEACRQARLWFDLHRGRRLHTVWVNVSARQLALPELAETVATALDRYGLEPGQLGLELTESALIEEAETPGTELHDIQALGVRLAIDDFGTGYSSLLYLRRYHVDVLKLDRSFVSGLGASSDDTAIADAVIGLGHSLGMQVSAEGVETPVQLEALRELGCDSACGFLLARPTTPQIVGELLREPARH